MTALLVDGNNVLIRAMHAMKGSGLHARGVPTGALLVFINSLSRHLKEERPDKVAICWDAGRSAFRTELDPGYKAHRLDGPTEFEEDKTTAFGLAKRFLTLANVHHIERRGFEADDLIAYYWRHHRPLDDRVVILSSDKDFLQLLVPGQVEQVRMSSSGTPTDRWTADRVQSDLGCEPKYLADAMAIAGDASDGVPGVPRFGMKTAVKTLARNNWSLDKALHSEERLFQHRDRVLLNHKLVDLRSAVSGLTLTPLPVFAPTLPADAMFRELIEYLDTFQLGSVKIRLYDGSLWK